MTEEEFKNAKAMVITKQKKAAQKTKFSPSTSSNAAELGRSHTKTTRPLTSRNPKTIKARKVRDEARCAQVAGEMMASGSSDADKYLQATLSSEIAPNLFPETCATISPQSHLLKLASNVKDLIDACAKLNVRPIAHFLAKGLPNFFLEKALDMGKSLIKRAKGPLVTVNKFGNAKNTCKQNDFTTQQYPHGIKKKG